MKSMFTTFLFGLYLVGNGCFSVRQSQPFISSRAPDYLSLVPSLRSIRHGMPMEECLAILGQRVQDGRISIRSYTEGRLGFIEDLTGTRERLVWHIELPDGSRGIWVISFFDKDESRLRDCILFDPNRRSLVAPITPGEYLTRLESVQEGWSIARIKDSLGDIEPADFKRDQRGNWFVRYVFPGIYPQTYLFDIDTRTGHVNNRKKTSNEPYSHYPPLTPKQIDPEKDSISLGQSVEVLWETYGHTSPDMLFLCETEGKWLVVYVIGDHIFDIDAITGKIVAYEQAAKI